MIFQSPAHMAKKQKKYLRLAVLDDVAFVEDTIIPVDRAVEDL